MKKLRSIFILGVILILFGCNINSNLRDKTSLKNVSDDEKTAEEYIKYKGYDITEYKGKIEEYILDKSILYGGTKSIPYQQIWGVQQVKPDEFFGKQITVYGFIVKNHPLEKKYKESKGTNIFIMLCEGKVIGGYSLHNDDEVGACDSLEGKTLEEITGLSYKEWCDEWKVKYGNK